MEAVDVDDVVFCNACQVDVSAESRGTHYKSEWHRYNVKRRCAGLTAITENDFLRKLDALRRKRIREAPKLNCEACKKTFKSEAALDNHLQTKKHLKKVDKSRAGSMADQDSNVVQAPGGPDGMDMVDEKDESEGVDKPEDVAIPADRCLFCSKQFASNSNSDTHHLNMKLDHMLKKHGFFIPYIEYLNDMEGLLSYLAHKIGLGHVCLYCNGKGKQSYSSTYAVQQHMVDKFHCKLAFGPDDEEEFLDFYNFIKVDNDEAEVGEDGKVEQSLVLVPKGSNKLPDGKRHVVGMNDANELLLSDGSIVGNRALNHVYKQNPAPTDNRESVLIAKMMAEYRALALPGYNPGKNNAATQASKKVMRYKERQRLRVGIANNKNMQHHFLAQCPL